MDARDKPGRKQKAERIEYKGSLHTKPCSCQATQHGAKGQHGAPCQAIQRIGGDEIIFGDDRRNEGRLSRGKHGAEDKLKRRQNVQQPDPVWTVDKEKAEHGHGSQQVGGNQDLSAVEAIRQHAGKGAH